MRKIKLRALFNRILDRLHTLHSQYWIESFLLLLGIVLLALGSYQLDIFLTENMKSYPWFYYIYYDIDKSGFIQISSLAATTIATTAALVFSITIVALLSIASNFSVRYVMHTFSDSKMRLIISLFIITYFYAFVFPLLYNFEHVNPLAQLAFLLFLVGLCFLSLVIYMKHIMQSIQVDTICQYNYERIIQKLECTFLPIESRDKKSTHKKSTVMGKEYKISAASSGYITKINYQKIYEAACEKKIYIQVIFSEGDYILDSTYALRVTSSKLLDEEFEKKLRGYIQITPIEQASDTSQKYIKHLIDIALKSLSTGVNDTVSAQTVLEYITAIIRQVYRMGDPQDTFYDDEGLKVLTIKTISIDDLIDETIDSIRFYSSDNQPALCYLVMLLGNTVIFAKTKKQKDLINQQVSAIEDVVKSKRFLPHDNETLQTEIDDYRQKFAERFND